MTDARLTEYHWCPWCPGDVALRPESIDVDACENEALRVVCPVHGAQMHDSRAEDFCWCEK